MHEARLPRTLEAAAVLLFLLQSVRVLFSVLFGVIYDTIFEEVIPLTAAGGILLLVVLAFLTPLAAPRRRERGASLLLATALVAALVRIPVTINQPTVRLWSSVIVIGAAGLYLSTLARHHPRRLVPALVLALVADQFLRTAGDTFDLALRPWWVPVQAAMAAGVGIAGWRAYKGGGSGTGGGSPQDHPPGRIEGVAIGALLFLETSLLDFPNGVARWSGTSYEAAAPLLMAATLLPLIEPARRWTLRLLRDALGGLLLLVLGLAGLAAGRWVGGWTGLAGLLLAQYLLLVALFRSDRYPSPGGLALGSLLFLALNFGLAFAFTYPYTIPAFRGMGQPMLLAATLLAFLPALRPTSPETPKSETWNPLSLLPVALILLLTAAFAWPRPVTYRESGPLRVGTYNIHYGYNTTWQLTLEEIARTIEESNADVVMLQEVDACRITSYGVDNGLWLARRLGMRVVFQPTLENLSGIALLTRFPIAAADGALLTSELEQTGIVHARLQVGNEEVDAYGIWLGLEPEERARQLTDALAFIGDTSPALLGGDFNATPDSPVYARLVEAGFVDPFVALGIDPAPTSPAIGPRNRIDFVWGRGLKPADAAVLDSLASDHRMVITEWDLP
ncbi:MAG TPA: hypothetical protein EYH27_06810 [Anaerolineales bacterium]|nr:hypothetical protein [Anaerolineales bacterium]